MKKGVMAIFALGFLTSATPSLAEDWQMDLGGGLSSFEIHNVRGATESDTRAQLQFGAYRVTSPSWRVGMSLSVLAKEASSWGGSTNAVAVRFVDVDYRLADNWAINANAGFARFYREQSSFGFSYGLGVKFRLSDDWYLSGEYGRARVDISTGVPANPLLNPKDELTWYSVLIKRIF